MSRASRGCPSDHLRPGLSLNVQVLRSEEMSPFAVVGISETRAGAIVPSGLPMNSGAHIVSSTRSANVSEEPLGTSELGSSYKSSVHVPPRTGLPALALPLPVPLGVP